MWVGYQFDFQLRIREIDKIWWNGFCQKMFWLGMIKRNAQLMRLQGSDLEQGYLFRTAATHFYRAFHCCRQVNILVEARFGE